MLQYSGDPIKIPRNILNVGLCVPASCSNKDLEKSLNNELENIKNDYNIMYRVVIPPGRCQDDRSNEEFTFGDIAFW